MGHGRVLIALVALLAVADCRLQSLQPVPQLTKPFILDTNTQVPEDLPSITAVLSQEPASAALPSRSGTASDDLSALGIGDLGQFAGEDEED
eukprot:CAMPEP_0205830064 /NCGR_PEP_ID=MMETSP0206-20130828/39966_1 /ASSEMBLY_ACC=CAM_ASM_000279 /TAXON_ID=36767 /ORGANISM="Euplotes focardii, Strain TN1" /LENGTH=91 /DNA_ID=CAMNT_0053133347 /DNA_START=27 /DNA_END=299 /DNA_ORIENTATION=+